MTKVDARGEANRRSIQESGEHDHEQREKDNPLGFTREDMVGYQAGVGFLYGKEGKWGYEEWMANKADQESEPIREAFSIPDDVKLPQAVLDGMQEVARVPYGAYSVGKVDGRLTVITTERWGQDTHPQIRTAHGWEDK